MTAISRAGTVLNCQLPQIISNQAFLSHIPGGATTTTSSSFANTATTFSFTKYSALTKVRIDFHVSLWINGSVQTIAEFAVRMNSTDFVCIYAAMDVATSHRSWKGSCMVPDLPAGAYSIQPRWRRAGGAGTVTMDGSDRMRIAAWEVQE